MNIVITQRDKEYDTIVSQFGTLKEFLDRSTSSANGYITVVIERTIKDNIEFKIPYVEIKWQLLEHPEHIVLSGQYLVLNCPKCGHCVDLHSDD